jgi:hypothetical protein
MLTTTWGICFSLRSKPKVVNGMGFDTVLAQSLGCSEALRREEDFRVECGVVILVELLKRTERKTLEFKRDLSSPEGILKCLVAFANTAGGIVVIGVDLGGKSGHTWTPENRPTE